MHSPLRLLAAASCSCLVAFGSGPQPDAHAPAAPGGFQSTDPIAISGGERLEWDQAAPSFAALQEYRFVLHIDGMTAALLDVRCEPSVPSRHVCSGRLPGMSGGWHRLELSAEVGGARSARSAPVLVHVGTRPEPGSAEWTTPSLPLQEGTEACLEAAPEECYAITEIGRLQGAIGSMVALPDRRLLFIEDAHRVRAVANHGVLAEPALSRNPAEARLVSLTVPFDYEATSHVYVGSVDVRSGGRLEFSVTRYREIQNRLGEGAVVITGLPVSADQDVPLAMDALKRLYVALPSAGDAARVSSASAYNGSVLRFTADGATIEGDTSPLFAAGYAAPTQLAFDQGGRLWLAGRGGPWQHPVAQLSMPRPTHPSRVAQMDLWAAGRREGASEVDGLAVPPVLDADDDIASIWILAGNRLAKVTVVNGQVARLAQLAPMIGTPYRVAADSAGALFLAVWSSDERSAESRILRAVPVPRF